MMTGLGMKNLFLKCEKCGNGFVWQKLTVLMHNQVVIYKEIGLKYRQEKNMVKME